MPEITETEKAKSGDAKVHQTMHEFKHGTLHSGSKKGPKVTNRRQAIAIALSQAGRASKAANYGAHVGQAIAGNLFRGAGGQFTGGAGGAAAPAPAKPAAAAPKPSKAATAAQQREARQKLADQQRQERQAARDQTKTDAQQKAVENVSNLADKLLDGDLAEVLTVGDPIGNIDGVEPAYGDKLVARGLANKFPDGSYDLNPTGRSMVNSMKKGNERAAKIAIMRAQAVADRKAATAARRAKRGKKEQFALAIKAAGSFKAYKSYAQKDFFGLDVPEVDEVVEPEHTGVMVAFYIDTFSPDAAVQLQVPGGETWDALHLTLAYLGDSTELGPDVEKELYRWISEFARSSSPVEGTVNGTGLFIGTEGGEDNAFVALFDSPALPDFRTRLMGMLQANGIAPVQNHGFTPHITLEYLASGQPQPVVEAIPMPLIFTKVTVKWGDKRSDFSLGLVTKDVKTQIAQEVRAKQPFTVFKDVQGRYRWVSISSSGYEDGDKETVATKALADDVVRKDANKDYGPLKWWHTPIVLGHCDFNAMDDRLLVESGTFKSEGIAYAFKQAIDTGKFKPGISLEFEHDHPERGVYPIPGLTFNYINRSSRDLLPAWKASNKLTRFETYKLNSSEVNKEMIDTEKLKMLETIMPAELLEGLLSGNELAKKQAEAANTAYKAMSPTKPPPPVIDKAAPGPGDPNALVEGSPEEEAAETPQEEAAEPPDPGEELAPEGDSPDAMLADFFAEIKDMVMSNMGEYVSQLQAAITSAKPVASKETTEALEVNTLAVKEMTTAFTQVLGENATLKARLDALEGKQPPVVAQRASAAKSNQVTNPELIEALKAQNQPTVDPNDPFAFAYNGWNAAGAPLPLNR